MAARKPSGISFGHCWRRLVYGCTGVLVFAGAQAAPVVDTHYGNGGVARLGTPFAGSEDSVAVAVRTPDGRMIVAGTSQGRRNAFMHVLRFTADGHLDQGFGDAGVVLLPQASPTQIALQGDSLLIGGYDGPDSNDYFIARIDSSGRIDQAFGTGGVFRLSGALHGWNRFVPQPDGKLVVVSSLGVEAPDLGFYRLALRFSRLAPNGAIDPDFGERMLIPGDFDATGLYAARIGEDGGGGFVMAAPTLERLPGGGVGIGADALIAVTGDGALDGSFGNAGIVRGAELSLPPGSSIVSLVRAANERWFVGVLASPGLLLRLDDRGRRDAAFGVGGQVSFPPDFGAPSIIVPLAGHGAIVGGPGLSNGPLLVRLDASGAADPTYGQAGVATLSVSGYRSFFIAAGFTDPDGAATFAGTLTDRVVCAGIEGGIACRDVGLDAGVVAVTAAGTAVGGFGRGDGIVAWNRPEPADIDLAGLLVLPSGAVTAASRWLLPLGGFEFVLERLTGGGIADATFGTAGGVIVDSLSICDAAPLQATATTDGAVALLTHTNSGIGCGQTAAIGYTFDPAGTMAGTFAVARPDVLASSDALIARPDGRLLHAVARSSLAFSPPDEAGLLVEQTLRDGFLDPQFGRGGSAALAAPAGAVSLNASLALLPDGSIIAGSLTTRGLVLHKLDAAGHPVSGFGTGGTLFIAEEYPAAATESGRVVGIAVLEDTSLHVQVRRGTRARALRLTAAGGVRSSIDLPENTSAATFVALADDSIVMAGIDYAMPSPRAVLRRLLRNDTFDPAFGPGGMFVVPGVTSIAALALTGDGNLLVGGADATGSVVVRLVMSGVVAPGNVVEFHNAALDHYFVTANPAESAAIDAGAAGPGWSRTGLAFRSGGVSKVCRFYGNTATNPATGAIYGPNSHFYTATDDECARLDAMFDASQKSWRLESYDFLTTPASILPGDAGALPCPSGTGPVYRAYNRGFERGEDSNHRLTTSLSAYQATVARGWSAEGIRMCAPLDAVAP